MNTTWIRARRSRLIAMAAGCLLLLLTAWPLRVALADQVSVLEQLETGMTRAEVVALVGEPDHESEVGRPRPLVLGQWRFHTTPFSGHQLAIAFEAGRAAKIVFGNSLVENLRKELLADPAVETARAPALPGSSQAPASPSPASAPEPTFDSAYLFARLNELGAGIAEPDPAAMELFDRIPIAGTKEDVAALLGEPSGREGAPPDTTIWEWADGTVQVRYRAGLAREKQWLGPGWRVGVVGDVWTAEAKRLSIRASGGNAA